MMLWVSCNSFASIVSMYSKATTFIFNHLYCIENTLEWNYKLLRNDLIPYFHPIFRYINCRDFVVAQKRSQKVFQFDIGVIAKVLLFVSPYYFEYTYLHNSYNIPTGTLRFQRFHLIKNHAAIVKEQSIHIEFIVILLITLSFKHKQLMSLSDETGSFARLSYIL